MWTIINIKKATEDAQSFFLTIQTLKLLHYVEFHENWKKTNLEFPRTRVSK